MALVTHRRALAFGIALLCGCGDDDPGGGDDTSSSGGDTTPTSDAPTSAPTTSASTTPSDDGTMDASSGDATSSDSTDDGAGSESTSGDPPTCTPVAELPVTAPEGVAAAAALVWTGEEFAIAWTDSRDGDAEIWFRRIGPDGQPLGDEIRVTEAPAPSSLPAIAWNGSEYLVTWTDQRNGTAEIFTTRLAADGTELAPEAPLSEGSGYSGVAWSGSEYGVTLFDDRTGDAEIWFVRVDADGNRIGDDVRVSEAAGGSFVPAIAWTDSTWTIAWTDGRVDGNGIYVARVDADGVEIGDEQLVGPLGAGAMVVSLGTEALVGWAVAAEQGAPRDVRARRIDAAGSPAGDELTLATDTWEHAMSRSPNGELGLVVHGVADGAIGAAQTEVFFRRFDADALPLADLVMVSDGLGVPDGGAPRVRIAAADLGWGIAWADTRDGEFRIRFARVCP